MGNEAHMAYSDPIMGKLEIFATGGIIVERDFETLRHLGCVMIERFVSLSGETVRRSVTQHGQDALEFWRRKHRGK